MAIKKKIEHEDEEQTCELYKTAMAMKPEFNSKAEAVIGLTKELDQIAEKLNLSVPDLLHQAETSPEFKEEYFIALNLANQIAYAKE